MPRRWSLRALGRPWGPSGSLLLASALGLAALLPGRGVARADDDSRRAAPRDPADRCEVADSNIARTVQAILAAPPAPTAPPGRPSSGSLRWDRRSAPLHLDRVERRFGLRPSERTRLFAQGFVVPERLRFDSYAVALHEVYQSQLPLYVSTDAILHAVYAVNDALVADIERAVLLPRLGRVVAALRSALPQAAAGYPDEVAADLALYLAVAAQLLDQAGGPPADAARAIVTAARAAAGLATVTLFGRPRVVDFSQYAPRGHYQGDAALTAYFRATMWLSRLELNLVSRSSRSSAPGASPDPRETPREAVLALALSDLVERAGVRADVDALDRAFALLGGAREDVSIAQLAALRTEAQIRDLRQPDAAERLRRAIGDRFQRTARLHYMPEGSAVLPAIATLLGPRVVADTAALHGLTHAEVPQRERLSVADVAYVLGHDRALAYLGDDLGRFPVLRAQLGRARAGLDAAIGTALGAGAGGDLYGAWLGAVRALAERPAGALPSFMDTPAFADLRVNAAVAAFAQLRHNYVLLAGQGYNEGGCEIPDGYVEPAPQLYDALLGYADRGARALRELDPRDETDGRGYFARLSRILQVLRRIGDDELAGRPPSPEARRFLSMVVELAPGNSGAPPTFTGWYFDLFRRREAEGMAGSDLIADYYTATNRGEVAYAGVAGVQLGLFVVDTGGRPRVLAGPVARAFEHHGPLAQRLDDVAARALPAGARQAPWAQSYAVAAAAMPGPFSVRLQLEAKPELVVDAKQPLGAVTLTLLDHHREPLAALTRNIGAGTSVLPVPVRTAAGRPLPAARIGGLRVQIGEASAAAEVHHGVVSGLYMQLGEPAP